MKKKKPKRYVVIPIEAYEKIWKRAEKYFKKKYGRN